MHRDSFSQLIKIQFMSINVHAKVFSEQEKAKTAKQFYLNPKHIDSRVFGEF